MSRHLSPPLLVRTHLILFVITRHSWPHMFEDSHMLAPWTRVKIRFLLHDTWAYSLSETP